MPDKHTVYVVDDDAPVASALAALLSSFGLSVVVCHSAEAFLSACDKESKGNCLLLDVRLPGMNGLEFQDELAARGYQIPIVFISGHADEETSRKALANGAVAFFTKPCDGRELYEAILRALS